jgi:amidohydrolase family protein
VPLAVGTDASPRMPFVVPGFSALDELDELRQAGLSAAQVLRAATVDGARLIERSDRGVIAPGTRADVLLVEGNPLADVSNVRRIAGVMVKGRWMTAAWLEDQLRVRRQMSSIALAPGRPGSEEAPRSTAVAGAVAPSSDSRLKLAWAHLESAAASPRVPR